jgi:hypothetical protein
MSAIELFHQDGKTAGIFYCSECRIVHANETAAQACHGTLTCECGAEVPRNRRYSGLCDACDGKKWREKIAREELARYEKAEKIKADAWDGPVYADGIGQEWFENIDELFEYCEESEQPEYVWASKNVGIPRADMEDITTNILDNMWEDADVDDLNGTEELQAALDAFNAANKSVVVWNVDYSKAILLQPVGASA